MDKPIPGKVYSLTGLGKSIMNGNTWAESEVCRHCDHANPDTHGLQSAGATDRHCSDCQECRKGRTSQSV